MESKENIFRQKSLDKVSSPEQLDSYLKVTTPSVWLILIGIIVILIGVLVWANFGKMNSYVNTGCAINDGKVYCYVKENDIKKVKVGMPIYINDESEPTPIVSISNSGSSIPDSLDYLQHLVGVDANDFVFEIQGLSNLAPGYYSGKIVVESISPMEFIFN